MRWIPTVLFFASVPLCALVSIRAGLARNWGLCLLAMAWTVRDGWLAGEWLKGSYVRAWHAMYDPASHVLLFFLLDVALALVCFHNLARWSRQIYPWALGVIAMLGLLATGGAAVAYLASGEGLAAPFLRPISMGRAFCAAFIILSLLFFNAKFSSLSHPSDTAQKQAMVAAMYFVGSFAGNTLSSDFAHWERQLGAILLQVVCVGTYIGWARILKPGENGGMSLGSTAALGQVA